MALPTYKTKTKNFKLTPELEVLLDKRLATLGRLLPKGKVVVCEVELEKVARAQHAGKIYRAEVNLDLGGRLVRAEAVEETMENAIDSVKKELKIELEKAGSRGKTLARTGARTAKKITQHS